MTIDLTTKTLINEPTFNEISIREEAPELSHYSGISDKAMKVLRFVPIAGTIIGINKAIKAYKGDKEVTGWKIAKIITEISSFLIIPVIAYGIARGIKAYSEKLMRGRLEAELQESQAALKEIVVLPNQDTKEKVSTDLIDIEFNL